MANQECMRPAPKILSIAGSITLAIHPGHPIDCSKREHHGRNNVSVTQTQADRRYKMRRMLIECLKPVLSRSISMSESMGISEI